MDHSRRDDTRQSALGCCLDHVVDRDPITSKTKGPLGQSDLARASAVHSTVYIMIGCSAIETINREIDRLRFDRMRILPSSFKAPGNARVRLALERLLRNARCPFHKRARRKPHYTIRGEHNMAQNTCSNPPMLPLPLPPSPSSSPQEEPFAGHPTLLRL